MRDKTNYTCHAPTKCTFTSFRDNVSLKCLHKSFACRTVRCLLNDRKKATTLSLWFFLLVFLQVSLSQFSFEIKPRWSVRLIFSPGVQHKISTKPFQKRQHHRCFLSFPHFSLPWFLPFRPLRILCACQVELICTKNVLEVFKLDGNFILQWYLFIIPLMKEAHL